MTSFRWEDKNLGLVINKINLVSMKESVREWYKLQIENNGYIRKVKMTVKLSNGKKATAILQGFSPEQALEVMRILLQ